VTISLFKCVNKCASLSQVSINGERMIRKWLGPASTVLFIHFKAIPLNNLIL